MRSEFSRAFRRSDGLVDVRVSSEPVAFDSGGGVFELIDTGVVRSGTRLVAERNSFQVSFGDSSTGVSVVLPSGERVGSRPALLDGALPERAVEAEVDRSDRSVVWYRQVWPGVDIRYTVRVTGLSEDVVYTRAPVGSGAVTFAVSGAEVDAGWSLPVPEGSVEGQLRLPERRVVRSSGLSDVGSVGGPVDDLSSVLVDARAVGDRERPEPGAVSSLLARGSVGRSLGFGPLLVSTADSDVPVADGVARPLVRSRVVSDGRSLVEVSVDSDWIGGLDAKAFPVVLDPEFMVGPAGHISYLGGTSTTCGSTGTLCGHRAGHPMIPGLGFSIWRSLNLFDLTSPASVYGLFGAGNVNLVAATVVLARSSGFSGTSTVRLHLASGYSWDGVVAGGQLGSYTATDTFLYDVSGYVRGRLAASAAGLSFGVESDAAFYNYKDFGFGLVLTVNDAPPVPQLEGPATGKAWFAKTVSAAPKLSVYPVSDSTLLPGQSAVKYQFALSTTPPTTSGFTGDVASRGLSTDPTFQLSSENLRDGRTYYWRAWASDGIVKTPSGVFSFRFDRRLGTSGPSPYTDFGPVKVNVATGNTMFTWAQRPVATLSGGASVSLTYNSLLSAGSSVVEATPGLPPGWMASWGDLPVTRLEVVAGSSAVVRLADGGKDAFAWESGRWKTVETYQESILRTISSTPASYQWESPSGWVVNFDSVGNILDATHQGDDVSPTSLSFVWGTAGTKQVLREVVDPVVPGGARKMVLSYGGDSACPGLTPDEVNAGTYVEAPDYLLCRVAHMDGSVSVLRYVTSGGSSQITRIIDDGDGNLLTGSDDQAVWDIAWDSAFRVTSLRDPQTLRQIAAGVLPRDGSGNLVTPSDHVTSISYDSAGRVGSITGVKPDSSHARPQVTFGYPSASVTTVTDGNRSEPNGYTTRWTLDARGRQTKVEDRMGRAAYTRWVDADTDRVSWSDVESLDSTGSTVFMRSGIVYEDMGRPIESWGPANRSEFGASNEVTGSASGGVDTPKSSTVYDGGLTGLATTFWANETQAGKPVAHSYMAAAAQTFGGSPGSPMGADGWSMRASGSIRFATVGTYTLKASGYGPTRFQVGDQWADSWTTTDPGGTATVTPSVTVSVAAGDVGKWKSIVVDTADASGTGGLELLWTPPGGTQTTVPAADLRPEFGLVTRTETRVNATTSNVVDVSYDDPTTGTVNESYLGIGRVTTVDPSGLALATIETFEASGSGFLRRLSRQLPSGSASKVSYDYYGPTEHPIASGATACGVNASTVQLGMLKRATQADPDGAGPEEPIVREYIYDSAGRQAGYRASSDVDSEAWTCTTFDDAGRVSTVEYPAFGSQPARTVTYDYMVDGDPNVVSVNDPEGTVTTTLDWAGRQVSYTDIWGLVTTTSYDGLGRVASSSNTGGTLAYTYGTDDQVVEAKFNGDVIANPTYDSLTRMTGVVYPAGTGNAGNGTTGEFRFDDRGLAAGMEWKTPSGGLITSDEITSRDQMQRIVNQSIDGFDPNGATPNFVYDNTGRLVSAVTFAETPATGAATRSSVYDYTSTACGLASNAGRNGNRVNKTIDSVSVSYCYDHADRLSATSDPAAAQIDMGNGTLSYDSHGNTSVLGAERHYYDSSDRHTSTGPVDSAPVRGNDALLMVANPASLNSLDMWAKTRLQTHGWTVTVVDDDTITLAQADAADLVVISSSITSSKSAVVTATTTGVVSASVGGWDELKMVTGQSLVTGSTSVDVVDSAHPAAGGFNEGNIVTSTTGASHSWGLVGADAQIIATITGDVLKPAVFSYDLNDRLTDGTKAPGRRITWMQYAATTTDLTSDTNTLFDAAVEWAATPIVAPVSLGKDVLLTVGDSSTLSLIDSWMYNRLDNAGWTVTVVDEDDITVSMANAVDLVVVTDSTLTGSSSKVKATTTPVLSTESWGWPLLGLATTVGSQDASTAVTVTDGTSRLAGGLPNGAQRTSVAGHSHGWGVVAATAEVAATLPADTSKATVFSYEAGDVLADSTVAVGRRVGWFYRGGHPMQAGTNTRELFMAAVNTAAGIPPPVPTVEYRRDATDRIVSRTATGEPEVRYGHTGGSDSPQVTLDDHNVITAVSVGLPGGAVIHVTPGGNPKWSYPNLQGSTAAQSDMVGAKVGETFIYDPDGIPSAGGLPDTRPGDFDDTWMGGHQRPLEHATGLQPVIEMGARQYHPVLARFLETDPIEAGTNNDYTYPNDPTNQTDLNGMSAVGGCSAVSIGLVYHLQGTVCYWIDTKGREIYTLAGGVGMGIDFGVSSQLMYSNVDSVRRLTGSAACGSLGLTIGSGSGCLWDSGGRRYWSVGVGAGFSLFPISLSADATFTSELSGWKKRLAEVALASLRQRVLDVRNAARVVK